MTNLYLDPYVFACPPIAAGPEEFEEYVEGILSWRELTGANWVSVRITAETYAVLDRAGRYPLWDDLEAAIRTFGVTSVQARDVHRLVNELLAKLPAVEEILMIRDLLVDDVSCVPANYRAKRLAILAESVERLLILMCLVCHFKGVVEKDQVMISRDVGEDCDSIEVNGSVIEYESADPAQSLTVPWEARGNFRVSAGMRDLYLRIDPLSLWLNADCVDGYMRAIHVHSFQQNPGQVSLNLETESARWRFGRRFIESAGELGFLREESKAKALVRACTETILGINMRDTHWLRTGPGANDPQITRGSEGAWRRDIDHEYHLHYWQSAHGIEFASVVAHHDMTIPE